MDHAGADVGPARGLVLLRDDRIAVLDLASDRLLERVDVEPGLGLEPIVKEAPDLEVLVDRFADLLLGTSFGERTRCRVSRAVLPPSSDA